MWRGVAPTACFTNSVQPRITTFSLVLLWFNILRTPRVISHNGYRNVILDAVDEPAEHRLSGSESQVLESKLSQSNGL